MSYDKIGFWSVLAIVIGSQIGSAVFMLPANLAPFGFYSIFGWCVSGFGAIALSMVFSNLCAHYPKTGGPHVYINVVFGDNVAFFAGWTYWVVSWVSTTAVIIAATGYISAFCGIDNNEFNLLIELSLLLAVCLVNLCGVCVAGRAEFILTVMKFLPLFIIPLCALFFYDADNFFISDEIGSQSFGSTLAQASLITLWGFVGLESATAPAGCVMNPAKTIPKALVSGTIIVALIYIFNSVAIMGLIPGEVLNISTAPYVDATKVIFGGNWHIVISIAAAVVCAGTLNAWILTSGQISLGLSEDGFMPKMFSKVNTKGSPYVGVLVSCIGIVPILLLSANQNIASGIYMVIELSVVSFLFIYLLCAIANIIVVYKNKDSALHYVTSFVSVVFCIWVILESSCNTIMLSSLFTLSGLPVYWFWYKHTSVNSNSR